MELSARQENMDRVVEEIGRMVRELRAGDEIKIRREVDGQWGDGRIVTVIVTRRDAHVLPEHPSQAHVTGDRPAESSE